MNAARHDPDHDRAADAPHARLRRTPWWLPLVLVPVAFVVTVSVRDAAAWVGRPFAGFLFLDNRVVVSIGRPQWRDPALRRIEWASITAVDGKTVTRADEIHTAVRAAGVGGTVTYTLRRGVEVFRVAIPVAAFTWDDFATVFAPMLAVGTWIVLIGAILVLLRSDLSEARGAFAVCLSLGLALIAGPDQYGPYRFVPVFFFALGAIPPAILQLAAAFVWWPGRWVNRVVVAVYLVFAAVAAILVTRRFEAAVFVPLLYVVYVALANALLLYIGILSSAFASGQRPRIHLTLALAGVMVTAVVPIVVMVTYPLWTGPVSAPWFIVPIGLWPLLHGVALVMLAPPRSAVRTLA